MGFPADINHIAKTVDKIASQGGDPSLAKIALTLSAIAGILASIDATLLKIAKELAPDPVVGIEAVHEAPTPQP